MLNLLSQIGRIIPFNVVVDNIIQLNSQTQNQLLVVEKELEKYKSLKLTPIQKEQLQHLVSSLVKIFKCFYNSLMILYLFL